MNTRKSNAPNITAFAVREWIADKLTSDELYDHMVGAGVIKKEEAFYIENQSKEHNLCHLNGFVNETDTWIAVNPDGSVDLL